MKKIIINWDETLSLCNNNETLAKELLLMLKTDLPRQNQILLDAAERNDTQMMRDIVHQILGSCSYISLPDIKEAAEIMHAAIHSKKISLAVAKDQLINAMNAVIMSPLVK